MSVRGVIVADQNHTRFHTYHDGDPFDVIGPKLEEVGTVLNSMNPSLTKEAWSNIQSGRNHGGSAQAHAYDDHRQAHMAEFERQYCEKIAQRGKQLIDKYNLRTVIVMASPHLLGVMRQVSYPAWFNSVKIHEIGKDLAKEPTLKIYQYLVNKELLPDGAHRI